MQRLRTSACEKCSSNTLCALIASAALPGLPAKSSGRLVSSTAADLRAAGTCTLGGTVSLPRYDEWTIEHWRLEPRLHGLEIDDPPESDTVPVFWKDVTLALAVAAVLWTAAAFIFG